MHILVEKKVRKLASDDFNKAVQFRMRQRFPQPVFNPRRIFEKPVPRFDTNDEDLEAGAAQSAQPAQQGYILRPRRAQNRQETGNR